MGFRLELLFPNHLRSEKYGKIQKFQTNFFAYARKNTGFQVFGFLFHFKNRCFKQDYSESYRFDSISINDVDQALVTLSLVFFKRTSKKNKKTFSDTTNLNLIQFQLPCHYFYPWQTVLIPFPTN